MRWPERPIEEIPPEEFRPPFCPCSDCPSNHSDEPARFHRNSSYVRQCDQRRVYRFVCLACGRSCGQQTFATTYYCKRPDLLEPVATWLNAGSAHRQIARSVGCAPSTVTRMAARLGRHAMLFQQYCLDQLEQIREPVVYDDFESFAWSQDNPFGLGTAVGSGSWFVYDLEAAPHAPSRRSALKAVKTRANSDDVTGKEHRQKGSYIRSTTSMLDRLLPKVPEGCDFELITDGHPAYPIAVAEHPLSDRIRHRIFPNPKRGPKGSPPTAETVARDQAMAPVDRLHSLLRHSHAHHHRETIAFGRRVNALMERAFLYAVWRNFLKSISENRPGETPAMRVGLAEQLWSWKRVLAQRLFAWRFSLSESWLRLYKRELITSAAVYNVPHTLVNAF